MSNMRTLVEMMKEELGHFGFLADMKEIEVNWKDHGFNFKSTFDLEDSYIDWSSDLKNESGRVHFSDFISSLADGSFKDSLECYELERALNKLSKARGYIEDGEVYPSHLTLIYKSRKDGSRKSDVSVYNLI